MVTRVCGLLLGVASSLTFSTMSFAQDLGKVHNFSVASEISSYEYKESGSMKLSGTMYGLSAEYLNNGGVGRIKERIPIQLRGRFTYMYGKLDYDGYLQNIRTGERWPYETTGNKNYFFDMAFLGGVQFKLGERSSIAPYSGLGYRYLVDKDNPKDPYDYKREQIYYYMPVGADWKTPLASGWGLAFNTELDVLLSGRNTSYIYETSEAGKHKFRQKSGYGLRFAAKVEKDLHLLGIFAEPYFRYWDITKSNVVKSWIEPKNKTTEYGLRVGVSF